jgi:hypothetical protein
MGKLKISNMRERKETEFQKILKKPSSKTVKKPSFELGF